MKTGAVVENTPAFFGARGMATSTRFHPSATSTGRSWRTASTETPRWGFAAKAPRTSASTSSGDRCLALRTTRTASGSAWGAGSCLASMAAAISLRVTMREAPMTGAGPRSSCAIAGSAPGSTSATRTRVVETATWRGAAALEDAAAERSVARTARRANEAKAG